MNLKTTLGIDEDRDLLKKLKTELPGILNWMLEELNSFIEDNGRLAHNELFTTDMEEQYYLLRDFLDQHSWKKEKLFKDVYETYKAERIKSSTIPIAKNTVGAILKDFNSPYRLKNGTNNRVVIYKFE